MIMRLCVSRPVPTFLNKRLTYGSLFRIGTPASVRPSFTRLTPPIRYPTIRNIDGRQDRSGRHDGELQCDRCILSSITASSNCTEVGRIGENFTQLEEEGENVQPDISAVS